MALLYRLLDMKRSDSSREEVQLTAELTPSKEKLFCERITLADAANENLRCVLTFHGRILGMSPRKKVCSRLVTTYVFIIFTVQEKEKGRHC